MSRSAGLGANLTPIFDAADPRLDDYRDLREKDHRSCRGKDAHDALFVGEQMLIVEKMLAQDGLTKSVLITWNHADQLAKAARADVPIFVAPLRCL